MLVTIFLFLLAVSFFEIFGWLNILYRCIVFVIIFMFFVYQYRKTLQFAKEKTLNEEELIKTNETIQVILSTIDANKLLTFILSNLTFGKYFDSAFIYLIESGGDELKCIAMKGAVAFAGIKKFTFRFTNRDKIIAQAIKTKLPIAVQDTDGNPDVDTEIIEKLQLKQFILLPLVVREELLGLIIVGNSHDRVIFTKRQIRVLTVLTNQAAIALQNSQLYSKVQKLSVVDELTQIYNRRFFQKRIYEEVELAKRYNSVLSLAIVDIDFFKNYNDKNGHSAGDVCLKQVAQLITQNLRKTDTVARYGGEEFGVILPATNKHGATNILEKIRYEVEICSFEFGYNQPDGKLTVSAGVATYPEDTDRVNQLIDFADLALYHAKSHGRNVVVGYGC